MKYLLGTLASLIVFSATLIIMAPLQHLQCLMPVAHAAGQKMPEPGNPGHFEPPPGQNCAHLGDPGIDADHACSCHRECRNGTDEEGNADGSIVVAEDPKCRSWCFPKHCTCPLHECP